MITDSNRAWHERCFETPPGKARVCPSKTVMKSTANFAIRIASVACSVFVAGTASAYVTFFGEDQNNSATIPLSSTPKADAQQKEFLSKLVTPGVETFESQTVGAKAPLALKFPGFGNTELSATLTGSTGAVVAVESGKTDGAGRYSVPSASTRNFWQVEAGSEGSFTVDFAQPVAAFGFYGVDVGDFGGQLQLQLLDASSVIGSLIVPNSIGNEGSTDGSVLFFGFIAVDPKEYFSSVRFLTTTGQGDVFAFDNFTIGDVQRTPPPLPEPGSLALVALGLTAFAVIRRRP